MGAKKKSEAIEYWAQGRKWYRIDVWVMRDGRPFRFRQRKIPTREQAEMLAAKVRLETFEGRFFDRKKKSTTTVAEVWKAYREVCLRDHRAGLTETMRGDHVVRHLGKRVAVDLTLLDVDTYRSARARQKTIRGGAPASSTVDFEVEILKRMLNYAVAAKMLPSNPLSGVKLLREPNVRMRVINDEEFARLLEAAEPPLKPILLVAYDTGMRKREVLDLRWDQVDLRRGCIQLAPQDTKGGEHRLLPLTDRVRAALANHPRRLGSEYVFVSPYTGRPWNNLDVIFGRATAKAGLDGLWFHDLRRSFVTNARKRGVPESVVMRLSGHRTREVFDRYNIVSEDDLWTAVQVIQKGRGHDLDKVAADRWGGQQ